MWSEATIKGKNDRYMMLGSREVDDDDETKCSGALIVHNYHDSFIVHKHSRLFNDRPPPAYVRPPQWGRVRILAVVASVAAAGVTGLRRYNHGRNNAANNISNYGQGGCHAPFPIRLWSHGHVPLARPDLEEAGHAPFLTAYVPQGEHNTYLRNLSRPKRISFFYTQPPHQVGRLP
jgi:hypothetical protein